MPRVAGEAMSAPKKAGLLTLGEVARRLQLEPDELHALLDTGVLREHSRDEMGRVWYAQSAVDRLALMRGRAGKGIDDGRPNPRRSPPPMPSFRPTEEGSASQDSRPPPPDVSGDPWDELAITASAPDHGEPIVDVELHELDRSVCDRAEGEA
jgi:hypothetical protein